MSVFIKEEIKYDDATDNLTQPGNEPRDINLSSETLKSAIKMECHSLSNDAGDDVIKKEHTAERLEEDSSSQMCLHEEADSFIINGIFLKEEISTQEIYADPTEEETDLITPAIENHDPISSFKPKGKCDDSRDLNSSKINNLRIKNNTKRPIKSKLPKTNGLSHKHDHQMTATKKDSLEEQLPINSLNQINLDDCSMLKKKLKEPSWVCTTCCKEFSWRSNLWRHLLIHKVEKRFGCSICNKRFIQKGHLTRHLRQHTKERPFACAICDKRFVQKIDLTNHVRVHTGEKPHECPICFNKFSLRSNLNRHVRIHENGSPFECHGCHKIFSRKSSLKEHQQVHKSCDESSS